MRRLGIQSFVWTGGQPLAAHAKQFIETKHAKAQRRRATTARA